ncbi:hypothetical protein HA402_009175 [Bradysia odoriphaga]|nr:hypothetical protein HA402_009175 [Bradysia odoriphaga]
MPSTSLFDNGRIRKRRVRRKEVLRLLAAIMEQTSSTTTATTSTNADAHKNDFYNTGRVGRRNALPDILNSHCTTSTADLPDKLSALTTNDPLEANTSTQSGSNADHASTSTDLMNNT